MEEDQNADIVYEPSKTGHWKTLFPSKNNLLGSHNLKPGEEIVLTIKDISIKKVKSARSPNGDDVPVIHFDNTKVPAFCLNVTNSKTISSMYGSVYKDWIGKKIQLYATMVKDFGGGKTEGLRVRPKKPVESKDVEMHSKILKECKSIEELKEVWGLIPNALQGQLIDVRDEMKGKL